MRRAARCLAILALFGVMAIVPGSAVADETGKIVVDDEAWTTSTAAGPAGDPVANATLGTGDLPVGANGTTETKRSYLKLTLPKEATAAQISLKISDSAGTNFGAAGPVLACIVTEPFEVRSGQPIADAPAIECGDKPVVGKVGEDGSTTFVLDPIVSRWATGQPNNGIALVADVSELRPNYQVTFHAPLDSEVGTYTIASDDASTGSDFEVVPPGDFSQPDSGGDQSTGSGDLTFDPAPPPVSGFDGGSSDLVVPDIAPAPPPAIAEPPVAPETAPPLAAGPPTAPVAAGPLTPLPVNPLVWLIAAAAVPVFWMSGRGLGAAGAPRSKLDRLLTQTQPT